MASIIEEGFVVRDKDGEYLSYHLTDVLEEEEIDFGPAPCAYLFKNKATALAMLKRDIYTDFYPDNEVDVLKMRITYDIASP